MKDELICAVAILIGLLCACTNKQGNTGVASSAPLSALPENGKNWPAHFGFGNPATAGKIAAIDIDVRPDGAGLPGGSGTVQEGQRLYAVKCAGCHGISGVEGPYGHLVASDTSKAKTIGNYWPYATTVFDYIRRAMPFTAPGSLRNDEVYQLTAFLLYANKLIDSNTIINAQTLPKVEMPAKKLFVPDDRKGGTEIR